MKGEAAKCIYRVAVPYLESSAHVTYITACCRISAIIEILRIYRKLKNAQMRIVRQYMKNIQNAVIIIIHNKRNKSLAKF